MVSLYAAFFDFISGTAGVVLGIIVALVIAILVSLIVYFVIWIAIGVLGMAAGITVALFIYNLCFIDYAWADYWVPCTLIIVFLVVSMLLACQYQIQMIIFTSSIYAA